VSRAERDEFGGANVTDSESEYYTSLRGYTSIDIYGRRLRTGGLQLSRQLGLYHTLGCYTIVLNTLSSTKRPPETTWIAGASG
jgi:hypothetical protein